MNALPFVASREDGRSDRRVVLDIVGPDPQPEAFFSYKDLEEKLAVGTSRAITRQLICAAVNLANRAVLREYRRCLIVVRGRGYKIARANEHLPESWDRRRRAEVMVHRGLELLEHVHQEELTMNERRLHNGHMMVMAGLAQALGSLRRRQDRHEAGIEQLLARVDALEDAKEGESGEE